MYIEPYEPSYRLLVFDAKKEGYKPSEQRKTDQTAIDTQVDD